jgi:hypothetical protein
VGAAAFKTVYARYFAEGGQIAEVNLTLPVPSFWGGANICVTFMYKHHGFTLQWLLEAFSAL